MNRGGSRGLRMTADELREQIGQLRARSASYRRFGYYASADVLDDRAWRYEQRVHALEDEGAERMAGPRDGAFA